MRAGLEAVLRGFGETPMDAVGHQLELVPQQRPAPPSLGRRDVLVRVRSAAVGWVDLLMTSGQYQHAPEPPYRPGMEWAGEVEHVGADVTELAPGDRVLADGLRTGPRSSGPHQREGGFGTWAIACADHLLPVPEGLSLDQATQLLGNYETATHVLVTCGEVQPSEVVLIHGASGSTGLAAVHVAKLLGATVIATGRSEDKLARVKAEGADHVVCTAEGPQVLRDAVKGLTGGRGADVVYDPVGGEISVQSLRCVRFGARFLIVGWAATPFVARGRGQRGAPNANQLPTNLIMMKGLTVRGCPTVIATQNDPTLRAPRLKRILDWVADGRIRPVVATTAPLSEVHTAMRAKWSNEQVGGIVLHP